MTDSFRESLKRVPPIRLSEPLAATLGALDDRDTVLDYRFTDVVKMAGHACPTVSAAYLCCQSALEKLYGNAIPVRGEVTVTVYGEPDEGVYGIMAQVFSFVTGAASETGFKGLGHRFKRKGLLQFRPEPVDAGAMCFQFCRQDTGQAVLVKFYPQRVPGDVEKAEKLSQLMPPVLWEAATEAEKQQFQELWMARVEDMLLARKDIDQWLKLEEKEVAK